MSHNKNNATAAKKRDILWIFPLRYKWDHWRSGPSDSPEPQNDLADHMEDNKRSQNKSESCLAMRAFLPTAGKDSRIAVSAHSQTKTRQPGGEDERKAKEDDKESVFTGGSNSVSSFLWRCKIEAGGGGGSLALLPADRKTAAGWEEVGWEGGSERWWQAGVG